MVKALLASETQLKQERQSLLEQLKLAFDRQFAKRSEALKPYDESQGDLFNEAECEAAKEEEVEVVTTTITKKKRGKRKPLPKTLPREVIELDLNDDEKQCTCCQHNLHKIGEDRSEKLEFTASGTKMLDMFVLNMLAANASQQKTKTTSFKSQRRKALSRRACHRKLVGQYHPRKYHTRCHFTAKNPCLPSG